MNDLKLVVEQFQIKGQFRSVKSYGSGHIHKTYLIECSDKTDHSYILQKLNNYVFRDIPGMMNNIQHVSEHLKSKCDQMDCKTSNLELIFTRENNNFFDDEHSNHWRMYEFIKDSYSYDKTESVEQAEECGFAFGNFILMLSDMNPDGLVDTIPHFHDIELRLKSFFEVVQTDRIGRAKTVKKEIEFVERWVDEIKKIHILGRQGKIPVRITHNDTKLNNILFNKNDEAICVLDLDTVMPGYVHYDFGDAIRTVANAADEDEKDLEKVMIDLALYEGFASGFLKATRELLTACEIEHLAFSANMMTFMIGLRFLTDHIDGDQYYKIHFEDHNLVRAKAQFKLFNSMCENSDDMAEIIRKLI